MYRLFLDVGNTNIVMGLYQDETMVDSTRLATNTSQSMQEYRHLIDDFLATHQVAFTDLNDLLISSVVPQITQFMQKMWEQEHKKMPFILHAQLKTNLTLKLDEPATIGSDLLAGAAAAYEKYQTNTFIVDMGTATTIMLVRADGVFSGGAIVAGIELMLHALINNTALLSFTEDINKEEHINAIGTSTETAIQSGIIYGYSGLIDNIIEKMLEELGTVDYQIVTTGGQAPFIMQYSKYLDAFEPYLIFDGMEIIYQLNNK